MEHKIDSAGVLFVCNGRCLLAHSTNSRRVGSWMPPKGHLEFGESPEQAAIRETEEEIGWRIRGAFLKDYFDVFYTDKSGKLYKTVRIFVVKIENEDPNKNGPMLIKTSDLQKEEVDEIRWIDAKDVKTFALHRYVDGISKYL
jgi:8-oxo-dGTP pyrophosphatase MutT (NUDIX family)